MTSICINCTWFKDYESLSYPDLGFCTRFVQTVNKNDADCIGFNVTKAKEDFFRNLEKAKAHKIDLQQQLNFDL